MKRSLEKDNINIRMGKESDIPRIMIFIKKYWDYGEHIFSKSEEIIKYIYLLNNQLSFVIAEDKDKDEICGICGFIRYSNEMRPSVSPTFLKTIKTQNNMLAIDMINYIVSETHCGDFSCVGIKKKILIIYKFMRYNTGALQHYYRISDKVEYKVADIRNKNIIPVNRDSIYKLVELNDFDELNNKFNLDKHICRKPYKDFWYIKMRYYDYPFYNYKIYGISNNFNEIDSILICREVEHDKTKILKIVDFIGFAKDLKNISYSLQSLIDTNKYEYIDMYCYGIDEKIMNSAGFSLLDERDPNIIPNFFGPFVKENVDINFFTTGSDKYQLFSADSDLDRPTSI